MNTDINMDDVRRALQLSTRDMDDVRLIPYRQLRAKLDWPVVGYILKFDSDAELTVTHLAALAAVFGTHAIRVKYVPSEDEWESTRAPSELAIEVGP